MNAIVRFGFMLFPRKLKVLSLLTFCLNVACSSVGPQSTGATPNDLALLERDGEVYALVVSSGDAELEIFNLTQPSQARVILFPPDEHNVGAIPWSVALSTELDRAVVSLLAQNKLAVVDPWNARVTSMVAAEKNGSLVQIPINLKQPLRKEVDALNTGYLESKPQNMVLKSPQGMVFSGKFLVSTFANHLEHAGKLETEAATYGPGVAALFQAREDTLTYVSHVELPFQNPSAAAIDEDGTVWISCTGLFGIRDGHWQSVTPGGLVQLSVDKTNTPALKIQRKIDLDLFGGDKAVFTKKYIIVPSQNAAALWIGERSATTLSDGNIVWLGASDVTDTTSVSVIEENQIIVTRFSDHCLVRYDVSDRFNVREIGPPVFLYEKSEHMPTRGAHISAFLPFQNGYIGASILTLSNELVVHRLPLRP